jgi:hypothetical protein
LPQALAIRLASGASHGDVTDRIGTFVAVERCIRRRSDADGVEN